MPVYKKEQTGTWFCKFCYTDWNGARKQKKKEGFKTKKEAQDFERDFLSKAAKSCDMRFSNMAQLYLEDCAPRLKPTTLFNKETMIRQKILPWFGDLPTSDITAATVRRWQNELMEMGFSPTYLKAIHNQASAIFNFAVKYYRLDSNPCRLAGSMGKNRPAEMQIWTAEEFQHFLRAISNKPAAVAAFSMLFWTGLRSGELLALTREDFDFQAGTVSITKSFARQNRQDLVLPPKTPKSRRVVTLPDFLVQMMETYTADKPEGRIFPQTKHFLFHEMERGCEKSGVRRIRVHDLRHSHASFLIEKGFSPLLIAERLGHENIQTTLQIYSHLYPNKQHEVAQMIQRFHEEQANDLYETSTTTPEKSQWLQGQTAFLRR